MITASFSLADTAVHTLSDLFAIQHPLEITAQPPIGSFSELHIVADAGNSGNVAVSFNSDVNISSKHYGWLLTASSLEIVFCRPQGGESISPLNIYLAASAAGQIFHVCGLG